MEYVLPGKPLTRIQAINRCYAATGSPRMAMLAADADYNGHHLTLGWNDYRGYWVLEYTWAGRNVLYRGTDFAQACRVTKEEFSRQGAGASCTIYPRTPEEETIALAEGFTMRIKTSAEQPWWAPLVPQAVQFERQMGIPATSFLVQAESEDDYLAKLDAYRDERKRA